MDQSPPPAETSEPDEMTASEQAIADAIMAEAGPRGAARVVVKMPRNAQRMAGAFYLFHGAHSCPALFEVSPTAPPSMQIADAIADGLALVRDGWVERAISTIDGWLARALADAPA